MFDKMTNNLYHYWVNPQNNRYYAAWIERDLFCNFHLIKAWGGNQKAKRSGMKLVAFETIEKAVEELSHLNNRRTSRGYSLVHVIKNV